MRAFFDTEYFTRGRKSGLKTTFAAIAVVRDDGQELIRVSKDFDPEAAGWFFKYKVWKRMGGLPRSSVADIAEQVREFLSGVTMLVTREGGLDRRVLEELIGPWTRAYCDIEKVWQGFGCPPLPDRGKKNHHPLEDARWHKTMYYSVLQPELVAA